MQGGVDAAGVGVLAGEAQVLLVIHAGDVQRGVEALHRLGRGGDVLRLALGEGGQASLQAGLLPFFKLLAELVDYFGVEHHLTLGSAHVRDNADGSVSKAPVLF